MARAFSTLPELLDHCLEDYGSNHVFGEKQADSSWKYINYREFGALAEAARAGLAQLGVKKGDRVALISNNGVDWATCAFGAYTLGACVVPMYEAQQPDEIEFILRDCGAKVAIVSSDSALQFLVTRLPEIEALEHVIGMKLPETNGLSLKQLLTNGRAAPCPATVVAATDLAAFLYTSGTTGNPKGVKLSHGNLSTNTSAASVRFDFRKGDICLSFLPWAHAFGQVAELFCFFHQGTCIAINDDVNRLITNLPDVRPTVLVAVPRIFNRIYDGVNKQIAEKPAPLRALFRAGILAATKSKRGHKLSLIERTTLTLADRLIFSKIRMKFGGRLRFAVSGSAALSVEVAEFIDALGIDVFEGYGLTETSPVISVNYPGNRKVGSIGKPLPDVQITIDTSATGDGKTGEILVRGPNVMQGYHNRPDDEALVFTQDGAFRTGDMGYIDEDGYLFITGRIKEQYKLENGKYIVPSPLEEQLKLSPYVTNVMLYGANRAFNVALVVPDMQALFEFAQRDGLATHQLEMNPKVVQLLQSELDKFSENFKGYERPKKILITAQDFTTENGQLTHSMKVKRREVLAVYGDRLDALFRQ